MSNLKQIGLGIMQYTQDYDERFPQRYYGDAGVRQQANTWRRNIFPYVKSTQLFSCPSNTNNTILADDSTPGNLSAAGLPPDSPLFYRSYAINGANTFGGTPPSEYVVGAALSQIPMTSETILVAEHSQGRAYTGDMANDTSWGDPTYVFKGHLNFCNFLFCDGHVKAMKPLATAIPKNLWSGEDDGQMDPASRGWTRINYWQQLVDKS